MTHLLQAEGVTKRFAGVTALSDVSLAVDRGERIGLIGPNGAGKTTLFNCLLGVLPTDAGSVSLDGAPIDRLPVHERARRGLARTFQRIELFGGTSVLEHLLVADRAHLGGRRIRRDLFGRNRPTAEELGRCHHVLDLLGLGRLAGEPIERLTLGQARLVEVGRALMLEPMVLLLDEPSSGLDRAETAALATTLRSVQDQKGFAVLLVEHDIELVASFTEYAVLMDYGRVLTAGPTAEVMQSSDMRRAYLGEDVE